MSSNIDIKLYDINEAAKELGVTSRTVSTYIKNKRIPAQKIGGRWKITEENLKKFIKGEL